MLPGDRIICGFVKKQPVGAEFKDWPPHITIVPWFRLDVTSPQLAEQLQKHYIGSRPFRVAALGEVQLGYKKKKLANLVVAPELMKLEGQTRRLLHAHKAWIVDEADKTRRGFRPHVTALSTGRVHQNDSFDCDCLYIVAQHGDFKRVDSVITLS